MIRISKGTLYNFSQHNSFYYNTFKIPKNNGGHRLIAQPSRSLKAIQAWILRNILEKLNSSSSSKGFEMGTSILDNAIPHQEANAILSIDLEDFFSNIKSNWVFCVFRSLGYDYVISSILTTLCTYNGYLPQGGPCSPKLSNLVCLSPGFKIRRVCWEKEHYLHSIRRRFDFFCYKYQQTFTIL